MSVTVSGTVPTTIYENAWADDWSAALTLSPGVLDVALTGPDAGLFAVAYAAATRTVSITPAQALDAEALGSAMLRFGLTARTGAGWVAVPGEYAVALLGTDDTAPQALRFTSGGSVRANALGGAIGTLAADDPDSAGPIGFSVAWPDAAFFEVVDDTLRLRPGVDLMAVSASFRDVLVEASDGLNHAAFLLRVTILPPAEPVVPVDGTTGADSMTGTEAEDWLLGHGGADTLSGLDGADTLDGGADGDSLAGGVGADMLSGGAGNDTLRGSGDPDNLSGGSGADVLDGGSGNDLLSGGEGGDRLSGTSGRDRLEGEAGADTLDGGADNDTLDGGEDGDTLAGAEGLDSLLGGAGADTLEGGPGADTLAGGPGDDSYVWDPEDLILEEEGEGVDEVVVAASFTILPGWERLRLRGGAGDLSATGSNLAEALVGNEGANTLAGLDGADTLDGAAGADSLAAGPGADLGLGGAGLDTLAGEAGDDTLSGGGEADLVDGGEGADLLWGGEAGDRLFGGVADDILFGEAGADTLLGDAARDTLHGGDGADLLEGGSGDDLLMGGAEGDTLLGGGADRLEGGSGNDLLNAGAEGGAELRGGAGADTLDATGGEARGSVLFGGFGDDVYLVDAAADLVLEEDGGGEDLLRVDIAGGGHVLSAFVESLLLLGGTSWGTGNALANRITGNASGNLLRGAVGADTLDGGAGDDTLQGGAGADVFLLAAGPDRDRLRDFTPWEDRLLLTGSWYGSPDAAAAALRAGAGGAVLPLPGGGSILFEGVAAGSLRAGDFLLG
jgi:Ca2+-binding RTX toxin-like protein